MAKKVGLNRLPSIPKTIKVLHHTYTIVEEMENLDTELDGNYGYCDFNNTKIVIKKDMSHSKKQETLLHEVMHACIEAGIVPIYPENAYKKMNSDEWEHRYIYALENTLLNVLKDNPKFVEFLIK